MASPSQDLDTEAQTNSVTETQPAIIANPPPTTNTTSLQLPTSADPLPQATNTNQHHNGNPPAQQTADNSHVQRDENQGDSSDGLWSIYLTESEKQDAEVLESWKGDTNGIIVFTGLFSATVAAFILESYKTLSHDSGDTTNALLTQISLQLVNISNGTPLASVAAQRSQPFKPTASAVRVNVFWFLSLVLSLSCALSATLMQQWARRYQELAQRRGAFHRRGRMRAYIFDGINRFGMARAVATMPTLLHISVFLFFAGLVDFLFPIYTTVAYATLGYIMVFALAYAILTVLPTIRLDCPYGTPLSGFTWVISQLSVIGFLWTILKIEGLFRKSLSKSWSPASGSLLAPEPHGLKRWRETLENQVKMRRQWFSQGMRKSFELSAYEADSTVVTSALVWTLGALDEDKEIEDFAARVPGFFDSRVVPDATFKLAILPLMSHQPNTDPIFGSRLYDLLKTCIPETSILDEKTRKTRLQVCMKCLWYFGRAYNELGASQLLPSYFPNTLASPEITRCIQTEGDSAVRVIGRCFIALIVNKLTADLNSRTDQISDGELKCLSALLGTSLYEVKILLDQPGAVAQANLISLMFDEAGTLVTDVVPPDVLDVVRQTLDILSKALSSQANTKVQLDQPIAIINGSDGTFESILVSHLLDLLNTCVTSPLTERVRTGCLLRVCLKGLWYFGRMFNQPGDSVPLPSHGCVAFANPEAIRHIREQHDLAVRVIGRCVEALVVNKLAADINSREVSGSVSDDELACLSAILGTKSHDVMIFLNHPGAIEFTNMVFLALDNFYSSASARVSSDVPGVVQQTFGILSQVLPLNATMPPYQTETPTNVPDGTSSPTLSPTAAMYRNILRERMKNLWHFTREYSERGSSVPLPSYVCIAFTNPEMTRRIREEQDLTVRVIGRCVEALVVNKLAADINSRDVSESVTDDELACLSAILGSKSDDVMLWLDHPGAIEFTNMVFLALDDFYSFTLETVPSYVLDVVQQTFSALSQALPPELNTMMRLNQTDTLMNVSDGTPSLTAAMYRSVLRVWMKNLWDFTREYNERGNSVPLPSYVRIAFTNPEMTRRIREDFDLAIRVIGRCVEALVVNKLAADINSRNDPVSNDELACLSTILGTESNDVRLCLGQPGTIQLVNLASLALSDDSPLQADQLPPDTRSVLQLTLAILSQALPAQGNAELLPDQTAALFNVSDDNFEHIIVSRLHGLLKMCIPGAPSLIEEVRASCLRMCLKTLWHCGKAYNQTSDPLPSYFPLVLATPEISRHFQTEQDPVSRMTGCCFGALTVNKLVDALKSPIFVSGSVRNAELARISAILGTEHREVLLLPHQLRIINFRNVVFLMSGEIDTLFTAAGMPADVLNIAQDTLYILANSLRCCMFVLEVLPRNQHQLLQEIESDVVNALSSDQLKDETVKTLDRLRQILGKLLPGVEQSQDTPIQDLDH